MTIKELIIQVNDGKIISDIGLQREIIYNEEKQALVIDSIVNNVPLPAFYLWENQDGILEVLDGKQRIYAITQFVHNNLEYENKIWKQTSAEIQDKFNNTELSVIISSGNEELKRKIFYRINTLGIPLSNFEVLNGLYSGEYLRGLTSFVKNDKETIKVFGTNNRGSVQYEIAGMIADKLNNKMKIYDYIQQQKDTSFAADQKRIKPYINFVREIFNEYKNRSILFEHSFKYLKDKTIWLNAKDRINKAITTYLKSDYYKLTKNKTEDYEEIILATVEGITVDPKRLFSQTDKEELLKTSPRNADGLYQCNGCKQHFDEKLLEVDHIVAWTKGGKTDLSNAQLLCRNCNRKKSNK